MHDVRDDVVDFVRKWSDKAEISVVKMIDSIGIERSKYYEWKGRYGKANEHNRWIPRDYWLEEWEKDAIIKYYRGHPSEGYRRLTYMMMDEDIVAVSPSSVYRVLKGAGLLNRWNSSESKKGKGFAQPEGPHEHWHIDISYINIRGTYYYLCSVLDGYSRYIVHWEIREGMKERDVEVIIERAKEKVKGARPRIITDNGPQFVAREFHEYIRISGMRHIRTSPYYPQSNGKIERWHSSLKRECIRVKTPISLEEARREVERYVEYYNNRRLHSAIGYITPKDKLEGREVEIFASRDRKIEEARKWREEKRKMEGINVGVSVNNSSIGGKDVV